MKKLDKYKLAREFIDIYSAKGLNVDKSLLSEFYVLLIKYNEIIDKVEKVK